MNMEEIKPILQCADCDKDGLVVGQFVLALEYKSEETIRLRLFYRAYPDTILLDGMISWTSDSTSPLADIGPSLVVVYDRIKDAWFSEDAIPNRWMAILPCAIEMFLKE